MKKLFTVIGCVMLSGSLFAQVPAATATSMDALAKNAAAQSGSTPVKAWTYGGNAGLTLAQVSFSNWSPGGNASIALEATFNYWLNYKKGNHLWTNRLELAYGFNNTVGTGPRKTNDKIYLTSNYGYKIAPKLYAGALATFNTQFANGYDYSTSTTDYISRFMAPGYLSIGLGLTYTPSAWFRLIVSPLTMRETFVDDTMLSNLGSFGVTPGKRLLSELGADVRAEVQTKLWERLGLYTRLELFSNYLSNPQNIVVNWDVQLNYELNKWLSANLNVNMVYDDKVRFGVTESTPGGPRLQIKEVLGLGIQAKF